MSGIVLPNGQPAVPTPKPVQGIVDKYGNKLLVDPDTGATIIFGKNGCVGFQDANGVTMRTTPDGVIEFRGATVRYITETPPEFLQVIPDEGEAETEEGK